MKVTSPVSTQLESWLGGEVESVDIMIGQSTLTLEENLRYLPKKRLTCRANWQGEMVIAKFFYGIKFAEYAVNEQRTINALAAAIIDTPKLLYMHQGDDFAVLLIEYIPDSISLLHWLKNEPSEHDFEKVMSNVTVLMLECHQSGFVIHDPHLENFLLRDEKVFIIDAGDVEFSQSPVTIHSAIRNMALMYAQLYVRWDRVAYRVLQCVYLGANSENSIDEIEWQNLLYKQRQWKKKQFIDKKIYRECSRFVCKKSKDRFLIMDRQSYSEALESALLNLDTLIDSGVRLKSGNTATVTKIKVANQNYVLKRYNIKKPVRAMLKGLMWSRAAISWKNGNILRMLGIPTAMPIALIEERWWGLFRRRSYLLTEEIKGPHVGEVFNNPEIIDVEKDNLASEIYDLFEQLKQSQISHGDMKASNILCNKTGPVFIDLDGMRIHKCRKIFKAQFKKDIQRFLKNWGAEWETKDYFKRFRQLLDS